jgi:hypothetical protein
MDQYSGIGAFGSCQIEVVGAGLSIIFLSKNNIFP